MKKLLTLLIAVTLAATCASARSFKIIQINTPTINIGGNDLKPGDSFDESQRINWKSNTQVMMIKADNDVFIVSPVAIAQSKAKDFSDFLRIVKPTIHRGSSTPITEDDHRRLFEGPHILVDSLRFDVGWRMDAANFFYATFTGADGKEMIAPLDFEGNTVILTRQLFGDLAETADPIAVTIHYYESGLGEDTVITDAMSVVILPDWIR